MNEPPSPTVDAVATIHVVGVDARAAADAADVRASGIATADTEMRGVCPDDARRAAGVTTSADDARAAFRADRIAIDVERWRCLAAGVLAAERRRGELTLTFVDADEMAALNAEHMGKDGPTDVLSFPLDADQPESFADVAADAASGAVPPNVLLGDIVICPAVAAAQAADHAGTLDDELALLVVHGVLHVLGHDHAEPDETAVMRRRELDHLSALHWGGPPPAGFRHDHAE